MRYIDKTKETVISSNTLLLTSPCITVTIRDKNFNDAPLRVSLREIVRDGMLSTAYFLVTRLAYTLQPDKKKLSSSSHVCMYTKNMYAYIQERNEHKHCVHSIHNTTVLFAKLP